MTKNSLVEGAYPARKRSRSTPEAAPRLNPGTALIFMLLLSLGLWWALWTSVSSLISDLL